MAHLDHHDAYFDFRDRVLEGLQKNFPVKGRTSTITLDGLEVKDEALHADDIRSQMKAKVEGTSWSAPVYGNLVLTDNITGNVIERKKVRLAELPMMTRRYSYVVDGQEWQVDNQWQLRPGVFTKRRQTGELETRFNVPNKRSFDITLDPKTKTFLMERGKTKGIAVYPILQAMGVPDEELEKQWGKDILDANKAAKGGSAAIAKFYKADRKTVAPSPADALKYMKDTLAASQLRPDITEITLGKAFSTIEGDTLARATAKMVRVQSGEEPEDDRDSLVFKDLRSVGDYAYDKLTSFSTVSAIQNKMQRQLNTGKGIRDVVRFDTFNEPIRQTVTRSGGLSRTAAQINPVEMISSAMRTTVMGPGGISSADKVLPETKLINNSHFGFLDPAHTPESGSTGVSLHLPLGLKKVGKDPTVPLYNIRTQQMEYVTPRTFMQSTVVLPDQVSWKGGKPVPISDTVKTSKLNNELGEVKFSNAQYVMRHPSQLFDVTTNLIPFMGNTSGNRASYATHHIDQAISLENREAPLVQVGTGSEAKGLRSFEELLGRQTAHTASVTGTVTSIKKDGIMIKGADGKEHEVQIYNNFPLNDTKAMLDSTPTVKVGQKVTAGQSIADSNFSKNGQLALGVNLKVAYVPYRGYNYEDGVVISESAAKRLASIHLHKPTIVVTPESATTTKAFRATHPEAFTLRQTENLDPQGVIKVGSTVKAGDALILSTQRVMMTDGSSRTAIRKSASGIQTDRSLRWESEHAGEVTGVHRNKDGTTTVHVRTIEPMQVGDKLSSRNANKGIVAKILADKDMPHNKKGEPMEVLLNPLGVPGRVNLGQVLETAASKVAQKTGQPYIIDNFSKTDDILKKVQDDLKKHGLEDTEELYDPLTKVSIGRALAGPQHMLKLTHQVDKKISARSGMSIKGGEPEGYDRNLMPTGGGKAGAQSMGNLGMYTMLAHGAVNNIREMQTFKSQGEDPGPDGKRWASQHGDVWKAIQYGQPLPVPKPTFAFQKFTDLLRVAGVNVEKKGHELQLMPLTDAQILKMSNGELPKPTQLTSAEINKVTGEPKPRAGGLFDEKLTGGHGGKKWTHFTLAEPMPNPVFEGAIQKVLGLKGKEYASLIESETAWDPVSGGFVKVGTKGSFTGGHAVVKMLGALDVKKEMASARKELAKLNPEKSSVAVDPAVKRVKYLQALEQMQMTPTEAYTISHVPVIPPAMRPGSLGADGKTMQWADLNELYTDLAQVNEKMKDPTFQKYLGDEDKKQQRLGVYDGLKALMGVGENYAQREGKNKGALLTISGSSPKAGYFQKGLLSRRQDLTMRSTIIPEPALDLDQVGLPTAKSLVLFRPFVVNKLMTMGAAREALDAQAMLSNKDAHKNPQVLRALDLVMQERPVLLKRDPSLHKHSVMAFNATRVPGRAIQIHPLATGGFSADFDGDSMSVYVPISPEAVQEARNMRPSNNLFNEATGRVMNTPTLESALGLYKLTRLNGDSGKTFANPALVIQAAAQGKLKIDEQVNVTGVGKTTAGRCLVATALPGSIQKNMLVGHAELNKKGLAELYTTLAKDHTSDFGVAANKLMRLGYDASYGAVAVPHPDRIGPNAISSAEKGATQYITVGTHTLSLKDFEPDKALRKTYLDKTQKIVDATNRMHLTQEQKDVRNAESWMGATRDMTAAHYKLEDKRQGNLYQMFQAGVKPGPEQYQQIKLAPMVLQDTSGRLIPTPVTKSYAEGLDVAGYWTQMHGARRGSVQKVQEVQEPGFFSKQLMNTTMGLQVNGADCGTARGIQMPVTSKDVYDRELSHDLTVGKTTYTRGTVLTPDVVSRIKAADGEAILRVRSSLKCDHAQGLCQKCSGISPSGQSYALGTNVGVLAAQALGERAVQLTLKSFHGGGVAGGNAGTLQGFTRVQQLTMLPKAIPNQATLAMSGGTIQNIRADRLGSWVTINGKEHFVPLDRGGRSLLQPLQGQTPVGWTPPKVGMQVSAGTPLSDPSRSVINPHDLYKATKSISRVQNHLVDELHKVYSHEGVRRQHVETVVKSMSNLSRVIDPGDTQHLKGDYKAMSVVRAENRELSKQGKKPATVAPVLKGINVLPHEVQEDWLARMNFDRLRNVVRESAAIGAKSNIHGNHPIAGMVYGAEFGLNTKQKVRLPHLANVPEFNY